MKNFSSDQFNWKGNRGYASIMDLLGKYESIHMFTITSARTGQVRTYELDVNSPGYEDGWDGEMRVYTDNLWDGTKITITNE